MYSKKAHIFLYDWSSGTKVIEKSEGNNVLELFTV